MLNRLIKWEKVNSLLWKKKWNKTNLLKDHYSGKMYSGSRAKAKHKVNQKV